MKPIYIHSAVCISAQDSFEGGAMVKLKASEGKIAAKYPNYCDFISPAAARRMAPAVKMGVTAATNALQEAEIQQPDAIITGSGMGCMQDTEKFLNALLENNEEYVTPTAFIQSTHNTVGGQIALGLQCNSYNNTYVHGSLSFESALLDAQLMLQEGNATTVLVGGIDELGTEFVTYVDLKEKQDAHPKKVPIAEGAAFFVLSHQAKDKGVLLKDMQTYRLTSEDCIVAKMLQFLVKNQLSASDIDVLFLGNTGDCYDAYYHGISNRFSAEIVRIPFKEFAGDFYTCIGFALWWAFDILGNNKKDEKKHVLIYNQEKGQNHSFLLLSRT
ncbi:beta-ketoacyl synthase chain length factor [Rasiella sp. SM2506]|uniref:beta-ketoacyl synthase chain length factor n=1 Tax=Rasiella sp. SM2506 TaxID=3423914 RepID=UPI003D7A19F9